MLFFCQSPNSYRYLHQNRAPTQGKDRSHMPDFWKDQIAADDYTLLYSDCREELPPDEVERIVSELHEGLPGNNVRDYFINQPTIFTDYDHLTIARDPESDNTIGLLGSRWFRSPDNTFTFLYLWTAISVHRVRRKGLLNTMFLWQLEKSIGEKGVPPIIATKTTNPIVFKAIRTFHSLVPGSRLYPNIDGSSQDAELVAKAHQVVALLCPTLEVKYDTAVVLKGMATLAANFFPELPTSGDPAIDEYFRKHLTPDDQVLMLVDLPPAAHRSMHGLLAHARSVNYKIGGPSA
jgi:hypothetical protein